MKKILVYIMLSMMTLSFASCDSLVKKILNEDEDEPEVPSTNVPTKVDPTAYFSFDGNFDDKSGNEYYGYGSPEPKFTTGVTSGSKALSFTKTGKEAFVVGNGLIDTKAMTICFWAKNISEGNIFYLTSSIKDGYLDEMMSFTYREGHLKFVITKYANHYRFDEEGNFTHKSIEDDEWHHIALVSKHDNQWTASSSLYIDGKLMDTVTERVQDPGDHYGTGTKFILGGNGVPSMKIAHLRVYDYKMLNADEIKKIYDSKK